MRTVGYVCVHGIGPHESGSLGAEAVYATELGAVEAGGSLTPMPDDPKAPPELTHRTVVSVPGEEPFLAEFYDGWWDRRVPRPGFWPVLFWTLRIAPVALLTGAAGWIQDHTQDQRNGTWNDAVVVITTASLLGLAVLIPAVLPVLLVTAGLVPSWRDRLRLIMVDVIGDAWLYRSGTLDQTVIPQLAGITEKAAARNDCVVLMGHSQGAELTRRVALQSNADRCLWFGSGQNQLNMVRTLAQNPAWPFIMWPLLAVSPLFLTPLLHWILSLAVWFSCPVWELGRSVLGWGNTEPLLTRSEGKGPPFAEGLCSASPPALTDAAIALGLLLTYLVATLLLQRWLLRAPADAGRIPDVPMWSVKSPLDPVSFGPAPAGAEVRYVPLHSKRPWWAEHVTYFEKPETGLVIVESGMDKPEPLAPAHRPRIPLRLVVISTPLGILMLTAFWHFGQWQISLSPLNQVISYT